MKGQLSHGHGLSVWKYSWLHVLLPTHKEIKKRKLVICIFTRGNRNSIPFRSLVTSGYPLWGHPRPGTPSIIAADDLVVPSSALVLPSPRHRLQHSCTVWLVALVPPERRYRDHSLVARRSSAREIPERVPVDLFAKVPRLCKRPIVSQWWRAAERSSGPLVFPASLRDELLLCMDAASCTRGRTLRLAAGGIFNV